MSQAQLAESMARILGSRMDPSAITRIEKQERAVRLDEAMAIAQSLDVPLVSLLSEDSASDNERELQKRLLQLAAANQRWEAERQEIHRLNRIIHSLRIELTRENTLDPRMAAFIDDSASGIPIPLDMTWQPSQEPRFGDPNAPFG